MTLAEETQLELQAKQVRVQRERIEGLIAGVEANLATLDKDVAAKKKLIAQLQALEASAAELPPQVLAKRGVLGGGGLHNATIACIRTALLGDLAGALQAQSTRLDAMVEKRAGEALRLNSLREGVKEFSA